MGNPLADLTAEMQAALDQGQPAPLANGAGAAASSNGPLIIVVKAKGGVYEEGGHWRDPAEASHLAG